MRISDLQNQLKKAWAYIETLDEKQIPSLINTVNNPKKEISREEKIFLLCLLSINYPQMKQTGDKLWSGLFRLCYEIYYANVVSALKIAYMIEHDYEYCKTTFMSISIVNWVNFLERYPLSWLEKEYEDIEILLSPQARTIRDGHLFWRDALRKVLIDNFQLHFRDYKSKFWVTHEHILTTQFYEIEEIVYPIQTKIPIITKVNIFSPISDYMQSNSEWILLTWTDASSKTSDLFIALYNLTSGRILHLWKSTDQLYSLDYICEQFELDQTKFAHDKINIFYPTQIISNIYTLDEIFLNYGFISLSVKILELLELCGPTCMDILNDEYINSLIYEGKFKFVSRKLIPKISSVLVFFVLIGGETKLAYLSISNASK